MALSKPATAGCTGHRPASPDHREDPSRHEVARASGTGLDIRLVVAGPRR